MFTEDLEQFFRDFAVNATVGAETAKVLFDCPDVIVGGGEILSAEYKITYRLGVFAGLAYEDAIVVDGQNYQLNSNPMAIEDGKLFAAYLTRV